MAFTICFEFDQEMKMLSVITAARRQFPRKRSFNKFEVKVDKIGIGKYRPPKKVRKTVIQQIIYCWPPKICFLLCH